MTSSKHSRVALVRTESRLCSRPTGSVFAKSPKYCFNTSNGTETITVSILFRRLKRQCFFSLPPLLPLSPGLAILQLSQSLKSTQNRNTQFTTEARVVRQTRSGFFCWAVFACRRKCAVGKLPRDALTFMCAVAQADCKALATTDLCRLFVHENVWLVGPWHRHSFKRRQHHEDAVEAKTKRTKHMSVLDDVAVIFTS